MQCRFTFKHLEPLQSITDYAQSRIDKIEKFNLHKEMKTHFIFSVQKADQIAEVLVDAGEHHFSATAKDPTLYAAIDKVIDKIERQLAKHKEKIQHHHSPEASNEGYLKTEITQQSRALREEALKSAGRIKGK
jgi:putative sigma-54 modulation protein